MVDELPGQLPVSSSDPGIRPQARSAVQSRAGALVPGLGGPRLSCFREMKRQCAKRTLLFQFSC